MEEIGESTSGKMAAIIDSNKETINKILKKYNNEIVIANINSYKQIIISGNTECINDFISNAKSYGFRKVISLNVSGNCAEG